MIYSYITYIRHFKKHNLFQNNTYNNKNRLSEAI